MARCRAGAQRHDWRLITAPGNTMEYRCEECGTTRTDTYDRDALDVAATLIRRRYVYPVWVGI